MFTVALSTIDKTWKQPVRGVDEEYVAHMHDGICHKKERTEQRMNQGPLQQHRWT